MSSDGTCVPLQSPGVWAVSQVVYAVVYVHIYAKNIRLEKAKGLDAMLLCYEYFYDVFLGFC